MLIIAKPDRSDVSDFHSLVGLRRALGSGAEIVGFSLRLTRDNALVLESHSHLSNQHGGPVIRRSTLKELRRHTAGSEQSIVTLKQALDILFKIVVIEVEIHERASVEPLLDTLSGYVKRKADWSNILLSSKNPFVLAKIRRRAPHAQLGLIHGRNPLSFLAWQPRLQLSAVGFHRLHIHTIAVDAAHELGILTYAYSVDRKDALKKLERLGVDAIATAHPERF